MRPSRALTLQDAKTATQTPKPLLADLKSQMLKQEAKVFQDKYLACRTCISQTHEPLFQTEKTQMAKAPSLKSRAEGGEPSAKGVDKAKRRKAYMPLGNQRLAPARSTEVEEALVSFGRQLVDALWMLDQCIEKADGHLEKLMAGAKYRVGVEWRPDRWGLGLAPVLYRRLMTKNRRMRVNLGGELVWRSSVEVLENKGLAWYAQTFPQFEELILPGQREVLSYLQSLIETREWLMERVSESRFVAGKLKSHVGPGLAARPAELDQIWTGWRSSETRKFYTLKQAVDEMHLRQIMAADDIRAQIEAERIDDERRTMTRRRVRK
jgi:hypothetical protein